MQKTDQPIFMVERHSGIALWRQIADSIRLAIATNEFSETSMIPGEVALAKRFSVNRHTVRAAIAALVDEGLLEAIQGRGTLVRKIRRFTFPISRRTRFSDGLANQSKEREITLVATKRAPASQSVAKALGIATGSEVVELDLLSSADRIAVALSRNWFPAERLGDIEAAFKATGSVTQALATLDVPDYIRLGTDVTARLANPEERQYLALKPGAVVLFSEAVNATPDGIRLQYCQTAFAADRVSLRMDSDPDPT